MQQKRVPVAVLGSVAMAGLAAMPGLAEMPGLQVRAGPPGLGGRTCSAHARPMGLSVVMRNAHRVKSASTPYAMEPTSSAVVRRPPVQTAMKTVDVTKTIRIVTRMGSP